MAALGLTLWGRELGGSHPISAHLNAFPLRPCEDRPSSTWQFNLLARPLTQRGRPNWLGSSEGSVRAAGLTCCHDKGRVFLTQREVQCPSVQPDSLVLKVFVVVLIQANSHRLPGSQDQAGTSLTRPQDNPQSPALSCSLWL